MNSLPRTSVLSSLFGLFRKGSARRGRALWPGRGCLACSLSPAPAHCSHIWIPCHILIPCLTWMLSSTGADNLQIHVTPTSESIPLGKLFPISPTWPFLEVKSSSAADKIKNVLGQPPDNTSLLQLSQTPLPKARHKTGAPVDFSSSLYQGSGHGTSPDLAKDSIETVVHPRPEGEREATAMSGLPHTSMLSPLPRAPPAASRAASPSQPLVGTRSLSKHPLMSDSLPLLPPPSSSSLVPGSSHSITPKPIEHPTKVPVFPQITPADSSSGQSPVNVLKPFSHKTSPFPSRNAWTFIGTPPLDFSRSLTKQYSELASPAGSLTPGALSSMAELSLPSVAPGGLSGGTSSWPMLEEPSSSASTQPGPTARAVGGHSGVLSPLNLSTAAASYEAWPLHVQTAESRPSSRELAPVPPANSATTWPHLSDAPENSRKPSRSPENTPSSFLPPLPLTTPSQEQMVLSEAAPGSPLNRTGAPPSLLTILQPTRDHASPDPVPEASSPQEDGRGEYHPDVAIPLLSSKRPNLPPTIWKFPQQKEDRVTAIWGGNEKANERVPLWALPTQEASSLHAVSGFTSDFNIGRVSPLLKTTLRTDLSPSGSPPSSMFASQASQAGSPPGSSSTKLETLTAVASPSALPASASGQVPALPSSPNVYEFPTMEGTRKPAATDVLWSSLVAETTSLSTESTISGLPWQTDHDLNTHTISSTRWEPPPASATLPSRPTSAANAIQPQNFKEAAGQLVTTDSFNFQDLVFSQSDNQPLQPSEGALVESHTDLWLTSKHPAIADYYPPTGQHSMSQLPRRPAHPLWPTWPSLASAASLQQMLSDGTDTDSQVSSDSYLSPGKNGSPQFQSILEYRSSTDSTSISTGAFSRTPSKVLRASRRPKTRTGAATNAGSLLPGTQKTGMTAFSAKASSSSTQMPSFALKQPASPRSVVRYNSRQACR